jgi:hypothetical protein
MQREGIKMPPLKIKQEDKSPKNKKGECLSSFHHKVKVQTIAEYTCSG